MSYPINPTGAKLLAERDAAPVRNELREAAQQFEAILLRQMLASARSTDFGGNDLFGGEGEATFREMRDARFAELTAQSGQLGFATAIENQLARFLPQDDN
ncbi:rod-binding protein [Qipengyuania sp. 6D47A]|uniref:Rod-binding protein n=2 Tax=Qipengyuania qiaonensis TaxID=2867240 RepID=A0ABS7J6I8_9SPHN|nr:rod-binding protein [Qipengyuania qiaonensis]